MRRALDGRTACGMLGFSPDPVRATPASAAVQGDGLHRTVERSHHRPSPPTRLMQCPSRRARPLAGRSSPFGRENHLKIGTGRRPNAQKSYRHPAGISLVHRTHIQRDYQRQKVASFVSCPDENHH